MNILRVDGSMRRTGSISRQLTDEVIAHLAPTSVATRDLADHLPLVDETWIGANFTDAADRTPEQVEKLAISETLIEELEAADAIVIGLPIYNFGVPAGVKAWVDLVARARRTFRYTENGPEGLLTGKTAYLVVASGGTEVGSEIDFATDYMKFALGFIGIKDVRVIAADAHMKDLDAALSRARASIAA